MLVMETALQGDKGVLGNEMRKQKYGPLLDLCLDQIDLEIALLLSFMLQYPRMWVIFDMLNYAPPHTNYYQLDTSLDTSLDTPLYVNM